MSTLNAEMSIAEILERYPETAAIFTQYGFNADQLDYFTQGSGVAFILKTLLRVRRIDPNIFLNLLEDTIADEALIRSEIKYPYKPNMLGLSYCPLKPTFRECFEHALKEYHLATLDRNFTYFVPKDDGDVNPYKGVIWAERSSDEIPDIITAMGFGDFFRHDFVTKFVRRGCFKAVKYQVVNQALAAAGFEDPDGCYTIFSVSPFVFLVDKQKLGNMPLPQQWSDLLNPVYHKNIIMGAVHDNLDFDPLLNIYKEHGDSGLRRFAANLKAGWHPSRMARTAGSSKTDGTAIYVIPWMFAKACARTETTEIIWPLDGAVITLAYMLVKESGFNDYQQFSEFVTGSFLGQKFAKNYYPVLNPEVDNRLPADAAFKWPGWDYIKSHPMDQLKEAILKVFLGYWEKNIEN